MGTPDFAVKSLDAIVQAGYEVAAVVTVPDRQTGRGLKVTFSPVKEYALQHDLPLLQPEKLRDPQFIADLQSINADLFVVVAFRMLPQMVWAMPPLGTFNLHASLLPQYRGAAPINWALINGEKETGVTTFLLNEKIDEGQILMQRRTDITPDDNAGTLHDRLAEMGAELTVETVEAMFAGTAKPTSQPDAGQIKNAPKIFKPDCAIDWTRSGEEIRNFVRGLSPYPAATTTMIDAKGSEISMKIYDVAYEKGSADKVGTIKTDRKKVLISIGSSCGKSLLVLLLQAALMASDYEYYITDVGYLTEAEKQEYPDNFHFYEKISLAEAAKQCDLALIHEGQGTIYNVLKEGCPAAAFPQAFEQRHNFENLIHNIPCGEMIYSKKTTKEMVHQVMVRMLEDPSYKEAAKKAAKIIRKYDQKENLAQQNAVMQIERFLAEWEEKK